MLHHLRCPSCFHDLDLPREAEQPGRLLTCPSCGWKARMWQWVSESRKPGNRKKSTMSPISQMELDSILLRSLDRRMNENIQLLSEEDSLPEVNEINADKRTNPFLIGRWEVHDLALLLDFTGNLDAPLP